MIRTIHLILAIGFVAGVVVQVFLAGLGVFDDPSMFAIHASWGYLLELVVLAMLVVAAVGRLGRRQVGYAAGLFGMFMLQSVFVVLRDSYPAIAALHPVNGFAILLVGIVVVRDAWAARRRIALPATHAAVVAASAAPAADA